MSPAEPHSNGAPTQDRLEAHPRHVAIIMDGNGRWAKSRGLPRAAGHERGVEALRKTVEAAQKLPLKYLTVYSFSTENWGRPKAEIRALFALLKAYVKQDLARLKREGVQIRVLGTRLGLPADIAALIQKAESETAHNTAFVLCIAFNYGGRDEIVRAAQVLASSVKAGEMEPGDIDESALAKHLYTSDIPDPDLLIRTSNEFRLSNFLIWQSAYTEFLFTDVLWPDFNGEHLQDAIRVYMARDRRFGGLTAEAK